MRRDGVLRNAKAIRENVLGGKTSLMLPWRLCGSSWRLMPCPLPSWTSPQDRSHVLFPPILLHLQPAAAYNEPPALTAPNKSLPSGLKLMVVIHQTSVKLSKKCKVCGVLDHCGRHASRRDPGNGALRSYRCPQQQEWQQERHLRRAGASPQGRQAGHANE